MNKHLLLVAIYWHVKCIRMNVRLECFPPIDWSRDRMPVENIVMTRSSAG